VGIAQVRVPALPSKPHPEFKPQYHQNKKERKKSMIRPMVPALPSAHLLL
jgi:hypothetical protein